MDVIGMHVAGGSCRGAALPFERTHKAVVKHTPHVIG